MAENTNTEREATGPAEVWLRSRYGAYRGHFAWRELEDAFNAGRTSLSLPAAGQEPVAWRTFDGDGGYDYRTYDDNENYCAEWEKRNPNHKGWVEPLYAAPQPAAPIAGQEPVAFIHWPINGPPRLIWYSQKALNDAILKTHEDGYKPDVKLYAAPQPAVAAGWMPIETAPKHESVLLYSGGFTPIYCGRKRYGLMGEPQQDMLAWRCDSSGRFANPTHWMHLPPAPSTEGERNG